MLVEVCGVDGSGKSTLIDTLRRTMNGTGARAYERVVRSESRNLLESVAMLQPEAGFGVRDHTLAVLLDTIRQ
ncbi:MAG TPA: hypothetical protein DGG94_20200 [Micromonosporaceae bacterium]|nr:hypothetical protein [Micromonosporaceae bacterium]HCU52087.1 hypothetical protein [Micromonosporaceae bacterium]